MRSSEPFPRPGVGRSPLIGLIALTIVAGGLRAATIEAQSFWDDELFTVWLRFRAPRPLVVTREMADRLAFKAEGHAVVTQRPG